MTQTLYLLCGVPGSGKSTWGRAKAATLNGVYISRDEVRLSLLKEGEEYFSHEEETWSIFTGKIQEAINSGAEHIIVDATHNNEKSRNYLLDALNIEGINLVAVDFNLPLEICLAQNAQRTGRALVPEEAIIKMWHAHTAPNSKSKYHYNEVIKIYKEE